MQSTAGLSTAHQILLQKQKEYAGLQALRESSALLLQRVEELAAMSNIMADGGEAVGAVLRNWPHVFSILNNSDIAPPQPTDPTDPNAEDEPQEPLPQLVRLPYTNTSAFQA